LPTSYYIEDCKPAPTYLSGSEDSEPTPTYTGESKNCEPMYIHLNKHEYCELIPSDVFEIMVERIG
ncbi:23600_t:CDS:1, partial [Gigaspora rosea]